jgi:hypothetical protein
MTATKTCPQCGAELGTINEIEQGGVLVHVLQVGNQYILDERALCSTCLTPVYWNTGLMNLQRLISMIVTGQEVTLDELDKPNAAKAP